MLKFEDDALFHQKSEDRDWRESYYCNFYDVQSDLYGVVWQGVRPNASAGEAVFIIGEGEKDLVRDVDLQFPVSENVGAERQIMGRQRFTCVSPWSNWRVDYENGSDNLAIDWTKISSACDWGDLSSSMHYEATGQVHVTGKIGDREIDCRGFGVRDRAWGRRNYSVDREASLWIVAQFPDGDAVHAFGVLDTKGVYRIFGLLHRDGESRALRSLDADLAYVDDRDSPVGGTLTFTDDLGRTLEVTSLRRMNQLRMGTDGSGAQLQVDKLDAKHLMFLTFVRFTRSDGQVGGGMLDYNCISGRHLTSGHFEGSGSKLYEF